MSLKQPNKERIDKANIQFGIFDYDGSRLVIYNGDLFTGYMVLDRFSDNTIKSEIEYKNGSHIGWENEYNFAGQLIYTCLTVWETSIEYYKYDKDGNQIDGGRTTDDEYYLEMVNKYNLD